MIELEVFREPNHTFERRIALKDVLRRFFEELMDRDLSEASFIIQLMDWDDDDFPGPLSARAGDDGALYAYVTVVEDHRIIYQHPHPVEEILVIPLRRLLASTRPGVKSWAFRLVGDGVGKASMILPVPEVAGRVDLHPAERRRGVFHIEELPDDDPPTTTLRDLNVRLATRDGMAEVDPEAPLGIVIDRRVHAELLQRPFSSAVEEGGFVIGHRYSDAEVPGRSLLVVTSIVTAESTGASLLRFTFTGESFLRVADLVARRGRDEHILGWFHTHLFPASSGFALSSVDVRLHETTFARPWQVAALINLDGDQRVLRWFWLRGGNVHEAPVWTAERDDHVGT